MHKTFVPSRGTLPFCVIHDCIYRLASPNDGKLYLSMQLQFPTSPCPWERQFRSEGHPVARSEACGSCWGGGGGAVEEKTQPENGCFYLSERKGQIHCPINHSRIHTPHFPAQRPAMFFFLSDLRVPPECSDSVAGPEWQAKYNIGCPVWSATGCPGQWYVYLHLGICH